MSGGEPRPLATGRLCQAGAVLRTREIQYLTQESEAYTGQRYNTRDGRPRGANSSVTICTPEAEQGWRNDSRGGED